MGSCEHQVAHQYSKDWKAGCLTSVLSLSGQLSFQKEWMKKPEDVKAALEKARWAHMASRPF